MISVVIPAYNEEARLGPTLAAFHGFLQQIGEPFEIIVSDDGSTDGTTALVADRQAEMTGLRLVASRENRGKGHAVRAGMLAARGDIRFFVDADGSTPPDEIPRFIAPIRAGEAAVVIATRYHADSIVARPQPAYRVVWSRLANIFVQALLLPGLSDPNCGFKAFEGRAAEAIFSVCKINGWSFDPEALAVARALNLKIKEAPVRWDNDEASKARAAHVPAELWNLLRIRVALWTDRARIEKARARL